MKLRSLPSKSLLYRLSSSSSSISQSPHRPIAFLVTHFQSSTFSTTSGSGSGSGSSHSTLRRSQHDEESRSIRVSVWWDLEKCTLPVGTNVYKVAQFITGAIRNSGIRGPISITAFGDVLQLPRPNQDALSATGISLTHVPQGSGVDRSLITDLMCWVSQNPPPAHLFLISNDKEFASVLHRLRMSNYNILLASKSSAPGVLCSAASIMWDWDVLIKGENVIGKHFNQPPDGPLNSWYGHYKIPLLDPFTTVEQSSSSVKIEQVSEPDSVNSTSLKVRPVPREVVNKIRMVLLSLYPKGAPINELRAELNKSNLVIDKDFYGQRKFFRFLLSMPDVLQVTTDSDGAFIVRAVTEKTTPKRLDSSSGLSSAVVPKVNGLSSAVDQKVKDKETANASLPKPIRNVEPVAGRRERDVSSGKKQENVTENDKHVKEEVSGSSKESIRVNQKDVKANDKPVEMNQVALIAWSDSSVEEGFFQKLKRLWSGSPQIESEHHLPSASGSGDKDKRVVNDGKAEVKDLKSLSQGSNLVSQISPSVAGESGENVKAGTDEVCNNDKDASPGFFSQLVKSFKLWGRNTGLSNDSSGTKTLDDVVSQVHNIFAEESSWSDVESFINSPRGFVIVSHSRTREMLAKNLQREGPSCLKLLDESTMLRLVSLLISHKKWIEEKPSSSLPFTIVKSSSTPSNRHASNGLSSIFSDCTKLQSQKQDGEKKFKNVAHAGVSVGYKSNAIADCQKLIKKITEKSPEGYNLIRFRKDFLEEYGYHLAVDKLGYENLQSLIQAMPGVRIASGYILPSPDAKSIKEDESDSSFEELGPVSDATTNNTKVPVYEPSLSEDEDSGSEGDNTKTKKQEMNGDDKESSLLQILDSYYTSKSKDGEVKPEEKKLVSNNIRKQKPSKAYSFVKDSEV